MVIYGISDLHLSFENNKPMDVFRGWNNYCERLEANWKRIVTNEDLVVLPGDLSWALKLEETKKDFKFLDSLPGKKVILKGNHDLWWSTVTKIKDFFEAEEIKTVNLVFNNSFNFGEYAVCGTRGWIKEKEADKKILLREAVRLETSLKCALKDGKIPLVFMHYPVVTSESVSNEILQVLEKYGINQVYHGHIHGTSVNYIKKYGGISFKLLSCDCIDFTPFKIKSTFL